MKQLIVYDLDGTLIDTRKDIALAANHMLESLGSEALTQREVESYVGKGLRYLIEQCLKSSDDSLIDKGSHLYRQHYTAHMLDHSDVYPHGRDVLDYFKARKQLIFTNKPDPFAKDILRDLEVLDYFMEVIAGNSQYPRKPDPTALLEVMKREGVEAGDVLFVGDSEIDIETGRSAGVLMVALSHGFSPAPELKNAVPDYLFSNFAEFLEAAQHEGW